MSKNLSFIQPLFKSWQTLTALMVVGVIVLGSGVSQLPTNFLSIPPAVAQRISPGDVWQGVYQKLPDFPKENQYISKDGGKAAENNTLASRIIRYHIYIKGRSPIYRFDWKLTLADYLGANEIMYDTTYPGNESLQKNPLEGDRAVISRLNRRQRDALVQILTDIFNPKPQDTSTPNPTTSTTPKPPQTGGAELLK